MFENVSSPRTSCSDHWRLALSPTPRRPSPRAYGRGPVGLISWLRLDRCIMRTPRTEGPSWPCVAVFGSDRPKIELPTLS